METEHVAKMSVVSWNDTTHSLLDCHTIRQQFWPACPPNMVLQRQDPPNVVTASQRVFTLFALTSICNMGSPIFVHP
jgi:hypothetical protein